MKTRDHTMVRFLAGVLALITACSSPVLALGLQQEGLILNGVALNDTYGSINDSEQVGDYLFLATSNSGVVIFDVSVPGQPVEVNRVLDYGAAFELAIYQQFLYVAVGDPNVDRIVVVVNIVDPQHPRVLRQLTYINQTQCMKVIEGYLFTSVWFNDMFIYDLSIPAEPTLIYTSPDFAFSDIAGQGDLVMVTHQGYLKILDISDPANPSLLGLIHLTGITGSNVKVKWPDNRAYIWAQNRCFIVDTSVPSIPQIVHQFDFTAENYDCDISGNFLFIAQYSPDRIVVYDVNNPTNPVLTGTLNGSFSRLFLSRNDPTILYGSYWQGRLLTMIDVSTPSLPLIADELGWSVRFSDMKQEGDVFVLNANRGGVWIVDWSDPAQAASTHLLDGCEVYDVELANGLLYVSVFEHPDGPEYRGIYIYDLSDPMNPQFLSHTEEIIYSGLSYGNGGLFVSANSGKLVYNVEDPANPYLLTNLTQTQSWGYADRVVTEADILYRMNGSVSLYSYAIANPGDPVMLDQVNLNLQNGSTTENEFDVDNGRVAIGGRGNVNLVDATDPTTMILTASADNPDVEYFYGAHISSDFLFTTSSPAGAIVYGIHNMNNPTERAAVYGLSDPRRALAHDGEVYLLAGSNLWRFQTGLPPAPQNLSYEQVRAAVTLSWQPPEYTEPMQLLNYRVYKDTYTLLGETTETTFTHIMTANITCEYTVTALFNSGESDPAGPVVVSNEAASSIELDPFDPYTVIPPPGGLVYFDVTIREALNEPQELDVWGWIETAGGNEIQLPLYTISLAAGEVFTREWLSFQVPGTAAPGTHTVYARVGHYPDLIDDQDTFTFTKLISFR